MSGAQLADPPTSPPVESLGVFSKLQTLLELLPRGPLFVIIASRDYLTLGKVVYEFLYQE